MVFIIGCSGDGEPIADRLLIVRSDGIVELALATQEERLLVPNPPESVLLEPAVSPDGRQFAYARTLTPVVETGQPVDFGTDLYLANRDGSGAHLFLEHQQPNEHIRSPVWLPDGQGLLVAVYRLVERHVITTIESVDLAGGSRTVVVQDAFHPAISPDGTRIAFVRQDENLVQSLWLANADGSDARLIAGPEDGLRSFSSPRFSPDGRLLAFGAAGLPQSQGATDADSETRYAALRAPQAKPALNGLPMDVWVVEVDGGEPERIAKLQLDSPGLAWASDGSRLFVMAGVGLFAVDPDSGSARQVAEGTFHGQVDWLAAR